MEAWIATLYEAAADDRLWPAALQAVERYAQAEGSGVMVFQGQEVVGARASGVLREVDDTIAANFTAPGDWRDNAGPAFCLRQPSSQFLNFDDYFSPALQSDDSGLRLIRQKRLSNQAGTILPMADGIAIVGICRAIEREPFSAAELAHLDRTRPHWAHAMQLTMYLERDRGRRVSQVLQDLNQPAAVLTTRGAVMVCNALFERGLTDWAVLDAHDRVRPHAGVVAAYLAAALARPGDASTLPLTVATRSGQRLQLHLVPLVGAAHESLVGGHVLLTLAAAPLDATAPASVRALQQHHGLTLKEARLVRLLADGHSLRAAADELKLTYATARTYLDHIYVKTDTHRQADLVRLVLSLTRRDP